MTEGRAEWGNQWEFILSVIGCAVGLGNVWRYPYLVFKHNGGPFLIPFFILLFVIGIPTFFLETAIGQFSGLSPALAFEKMSPLFQGVGYAAIFVNSVIGLYYNVVMAYCLEYLIMSFRSKLLWSECPEGEIECFKSSQNKSLNCTLEKIQYAQANNISVDDFKSPSEIHFYKNVLGLTTSITDLGNVDWKLAICLLVCWIIVFLVLVKGVAILGKVSYFTSTFPYVMMTILVINGALLDGADNGVSYYLLGPTGKIEIESFKSIELFADAAAQIFFALSTSTGALIAMSSFNPFTNNLIRDTFLVPILDILTGFYAGFAIFTVLGNMVITKCVESIADVAAAGPELAFIVYPEGISLMSTVAPVFSVMFFIMMLLLGFGSEFGIMETVMTTFIDAFKSLINTKIKVIITRGVICTVYFLLGLIIVTKGGFFVLTFIDANIGGNPLLMVALLEVICISYGYGTKNFIRDIECMVGRYPKWFWYIFQASWMVITPLILFTVLVLGWLPESLTNIKASPLEVNGNGYPSWIENYLGLLLELSPLLIFFGCAIYQLFKHRKNLRAVIQPHPDYYAKYRKFQGVEEKKKTKDELMRSSFGTFPMKRTSSVHPCNDLDNEENFKAVTEF